VRDRSDHVDAEGGNIADAAGVFEAIDAGLVTDLSVVPDPTCSTPSSPFKSTSSMAGE
jgi:hypothetical protein